MTLVFWDEQSTLIARGGSKLVALNADGKEKTQLKWLAMIPLGSELNQTGPWATVKLGDMVKKDPDILTQQSFDRNFGGWVDQT